MFSAKSIAFLLVSVPNEVAQTPCSYIAPPQLRWYFSLMVQWTRLKHWSRLKETVFLHILFLTRITSPGRVLGCPSSGINVTEGVGMRCQKQLGAAEIIIALPVTLLTSLYRTPDLAHQSQKNNEKVTATESLILPWICRTQHQVGHFRSERKDDPGSHSDGSEVPGFKFTFSTILCKLWQS